MCYKKKTFVCTICSYIYDVGMGLMWRMYKGIALDLIQRYPKLAYTRDSDNDTAIIALAQTPCAFPSGTHLTFWQRWVYSCEYYMKFKYI